MGFGKYVLIAKLPVEVTNLFLWGRMMDGDRHIAKDHIGPYRVSTVFLGLDHQHGEGPPLLFETMVFDEVNTVEALGRKFPQSIYDDGFFMRYSTWEEAEEGHHKICELVKAKLALDNPRP